MQEIMKRAMNTDDTAERMVYLAGPIDDPKADGKTWRYTASRYLGDKGFSVFNPATAFSDPNPAAMTIEQKRAITEVNRVMIRFSCATLVYLPPEIRPFGTIREIEFAIRSHTPVFIVEGRQYGDHLDAWDCEFFPNVQAAAHAIAELYKKPEEDGDHGNYS